MLDIEVREPNRTPTRYEFDCVVRRGAGSWRQHIRRRLRPRKSYELRFGFRALNFEIDHHAVWDSFYPLFYLTRNGGPLFGTHHDRAWIRFEYPIDTTVREFFIRRAADFGISITIEGPAADIRLDRPTQGDVIAFGGGKESRLILGLLRELGSDPIVFASGADMAADIPEARITEPVNGLPGVLADRVMPTYMTLGRRQFHGAGFGDVHRVGPWHQHYDVSAPAAVAQTSRLFTRLGADVELVVPVSVLPFNQVQRILFERYPELYAGQVSIETESRSEKNLHVSLLKLAHGIPFEDHCSEPLFRRLLQKFVRRSNNSNLGWGYRRHRELVRREMRAITRRHRDEPLFETVRDAVPDDWDEPWIDYVHAYAHPTLDPAFLAIYGEHAPILHEVTPDAPVPPVRI